MTLNPWKSPFFFTLLFSWVFLFAASVFPFWTYSGWGKDRKPRDGTLWKAIEFARCGGDFSGRMGLPIPEADEINLENARRSAIIVVVGVLIGRAFYWFGWERISHRAELRKDNRVD